MILTLVTQLKRKRLRKDNKSTGDLKGASTSSEEMSPSATRRQRSWKSGMQLGKPPSQRTTNSAPKVLDPADATTRLAKNFEVGGNSEEFSESLRNLQVAEQKIYWDERARSRASKAERQAHEVILRIREHERTDAELFGNLPAEAVPNANSRDMGGHFLSNLKRINKSKIFRIAQEMPKGCHQHLHFNSEIPPEKLFPHAREPKMEDTMFIRSTLPLSNLQAFKDTEIVFNVLPKETTEADIFSPDYDPSPKQPNSPWMLWKNFRAKLSDRNDLPCEEKPKDLDPAECWAREKMIITLDHAYASGQTHNGAWACFNQGTRAFKGLLGYESVYRWYIGEMIDSMIQDKVMYAELRPMLLDKTIPSDDGLSKLNHYDQMRIICDEVTKKQDELKARNLLDKFPFGLKIIYCTPRSIPRSKMQSELEDCIRLKSQFPNLICGFDLVGAEDRPNGISFYADLLVTFSNTCKELNLDIPFMFHAGETLLDMGGSTDPKNSNLFSSLLLNAKRIGHGYALLKHPLLLKQYRDREICLELCPISNELLHLCGNARQHPYPQLLAAGLHCTLNADNPSLFR